MLTRRTLLELVAAAAPLMAIGCEPDDFEPDSIPESKDRFPRTPMVGDVQKEVAVFTFFAADDSETILRVWDDESVVADVLAEPSGDGFHKVRIDQLTPGTEYQYAAFSADLAVRSLIGRFRTAPEDDALEPVTIAIFACVGQGTVLPDYFFPDTTAFPTTEPFQWELFTHASDHELDMLVHLGDQAYLDYVWSDAAGTVEAYLDAWGYYHGGGYRDLYPLAPLYASWDDHESTNNAIFDPWDMSPDEETKLANAKEAWFKAIPIDATEVGPVWRSFRWGATLELVLLDCRYELGPDRLMSDAQLEFLLDRIENSPCRFICVATPKPFTAITSDPPLAADNQERWEAYAQRQTLTDRIDTLERSNVIFVTGDIHMNYLGRATLDGQATSERLWEVCVTSGNQNPLADGLSAEQFAFVNRQPHLPVLTFDPVAETVHVAFYGVDGALAFEQTLDDV